MTKKEFKTTKADERAALELIRNILAELDPAGYVNTAFEGCCDIAESNIDNDFANSYKASLMCVKEKFEESLAKQRCLQAQLNASNKSRDNRKEMLDVMFKRNEHLESENKKLCIENEVLQAQIHAANRTLKAYRTVKDINEERIDKLKKSNTDLLDMLNKKLEQI